MEAGALRAPAGLNRITVTAPLLRLRSDEQLVALFRAGNDAAFGVIHDRYRPRLFAYARQMLGGSAQDAEDVLQDVFLRAYSSLRSNDRPLSLRAWLYRVAHNRCIDDLRKPVPAPADLLETSRRPPYDPIAEAERREDLRQLVADVRRLPDQQRSALLMREIYGLSYAELSDALGVTLQAVKSLLVRARIGLVEAGDARDAACDEIRLDLAATFDRGVRASGRTRKHLRDCRGCSEYRAQLRGVSKSFAALIPGGPGLATGALKLAGIGSAGSAGAATAGGGAAAGGGALVLVSSGGIAKVAAVVCAAALTAGGAAEVRHQMSKPTSSSPSTKRAAADWPAHAPRYKRDAVLPAAAATSAAALAAGKQQTSAPTAAHMDLAAGGHVAPLTLTGADDPRTVDSTTGGATAPEEQTGFGHDADALAPDAGSAVTSDSRGIAAPDEPAAGRPSPESGSSSSGSPR